jgi:hypothetical protein
VNNGRIVETSLGYFLLPLLNVALGVLVLKERMRRLQWVAVLCAAIGVAIEAARADGLPWIALVLAGTFGIYGLLRKQLPLDAASGLFLETVCMMPPALVWLGWLAYSGQRPFRRQRPAVGRRPAADRHRTGHRDSAAAVRHRRTAPAAFPDRLPAVPGADHRLPDRRAGLSRSAGRAAHAEPGRDLGRAGGV